MSQTKHKYRVNLYLGKEIYQRLDEDSKITGIPIATLAKIMLLTGYQFTSTIERKKKGVDYGE